MALGVWQKVKIEVENEKARIYLNNAQFPTMIVNDLKNGNSKGSIALWLEPTTKAYFRNLKITTVD